MERFERLHQYQGDDKTVLWSEYLENREEHSKKILRFSTGFNELDFCLEGVESGEIVVLSGLTGNGKTLFAKTLMRNFSIENAPCLAFSYEVSTTQFLEAFKEHELSNSRLYVPLSMKVGTIPWIEDRIIESKLKYDTRIVLIDHLHYVVDMNTDRMAQNIGASMRRLKMIATEHNQVIFIVAHQEKLKDDKEPGIETLRDSSFVGQEADTVIIVHRIPDDPKTKGKNQAFDGGYALVKVDKARRSGTFKKRLTFQKKGNWLEPI